MRDFFFTFLHFFCFCPDFEPSLGLFVFIFNVFFPLLAGIPETVGCSDVHFVMAQTAQKLVLNSFHNNI